FGDGYDYYDEVGNLVGYAFTAGYVDGKTTLASADILTISGPNEHLIDHDAVLTAKPAPTAYTFAPDPTISGTPRLGEVLTASDGDWVPEIDDANAVFRWLRDGLPISFAPSSTYELQPADVGHQ